MDGPGTTAAKEAPKATVPRLLEELMEIVRPIDSYACNQCGRADGLDAVLPNDIWDEISEGDNILCLWCIDKRCARRGITTSVTLHFAGHMIFGTSRSVADQQFIKRLAEERDALQTKLDAALELLDTRAGK